MGSKFVNVRQVEFAKSYEEAGPAAPIFFILSPGEQFKSQLTIFREYVEILSSVVIAADNSLRMRKDLMSVVRYFPL